MDEKYSSIRHTRHVMYNTTKHSDRSNRIFGLGLHDGSKHRTCASFCSLSNIDILKNVIQYSKCTRQNRSSDGRVVKLLACGAKGPGFDSRPRHLNFQRLVISCFQFEIWLKDRLIDVNPQNNQPTNQQDRIRSISPFSNLHRCLHRYRKYIYV